MRSNTSVCRHAWSTAPTRSPPPSASSCRASARPGPPSTRWSNRTSSARSPTGCSGDGVPFLGICIGLQVLFDHSEEGDTDCLGWVPGQVRRFPDTGRVPQIGWNQVRFTRDHPLAPVVRTAVLPTTGHFYFVNSYYCVPDRSRRRARRHRLHGRVLLGGRARQRRRHAVPRREERPARAVAAARVRHVGSDGRSAC